MDHKGQHVGDEPFMFWDKSVAEAEREGGKRGIEIAAGQILNVWLNQKVFSEPHPEILTIWTELPYF